MRKIILVLLIFCIVGVVILLQQNRTRAKTTVAVSVSAAPEVSAFVAKHRPGLLSVGNDHIVFLSDDDKVYGWGNNSERQLGADYLGDLPGAIDIGNPDHVLAVHTGSTASYLITEDAQLWRRGFADVENNLTTKFGEYLPVFNGKRWRKVEEHWGLVAGIDNNGLLWAWRDADFFNGSLDEQGKRGAFTVEIKPMNVANEWRDFCVSEGNLNAIDAQGGWWRSEPSAKLDFGGNVVRPNEQSPRPASITLVNVPTQAKMRRVVCRDNANHVIALDENHKMWGYGRNRYGELGNGDDDQFKETSAIDPSHATQLNQGTWIDVAIGTGFTVAIARDGSLWSWGLNSTKALGLADGLSHSKPQLVDKTQIWSAVGAGYDFAIAMNINGELYGWGSDGHGQLSDGKIAEGRLLPTMINGPKNSKIRY
ncbi:RCC1 domain-containing protein [Undibacterium sp. Di24W]|uniref:RCC1 domain-containing protein n=1 Tax=Undibacterium sp. Di24W TaxID=3413033 RepID=UPI003BEFA472